MSYPTNLAAIAQNLSNRQVKRLFVALNTEHECFKELGRSGLGIFGVATPQAAFEMAMTTGALGHAPGVCFLESLEDVCNISGQLIRAREERRQVVVLYLAKGRTGTAPHSSADHRIQQLATMGFEVQELSGTSQGQDFSLLCRRLDEPKPEPVIVRLEEEWLEQTAVGRLGDIYPIPRQQALLSEVRTFGELLKEKKYPILLLGSDCLHEEFVRTLAGFAADFNIPVLTTIDAKGALSEERRNSLGVMGGRADIDVLQKAFLAKADCILAVGISRKELPDSWNKMVFGARPVISIGLREPLALPVSFKQILLGEPTFCLRALPNYLGDYQTGWTTKDLQEHHDLLDETLSRDESAQQGVRDVLTYGLKEEFENMTLVCSRAQAYSGLMHFWRAKAAMRFLTPRSGEFNSAALCTAVAAKIQDPDRQIVAFLSRRELLAGLEHLSLAVSARGKLKIFTFDLDEVEEGDTSPRVYAYPRFDRLPSQAFAAYVTSLGGFFAELKDRNEIEGALLEKLEDKLAIYSYRA